MNKEIANVMEKFVANCNGICLVKDVNYLVKLLNESNITFLPYEIEPVTCEEGVYINIYPTRITKSYIIPIANINALLSIINIAGHQSKWANTKIILYSSNNKIFKYDEQIVTYNNNDYSIIFNPTDTINMQSIFIVDKKSRQVVSRIKRDVAWIKEIANERFPWMMSHIKRKQYIKTEEYISMLPDCIKAKIIPMLVLNILK
jgi:hypothetical protein